MIMDITQDPGCNEQSWDESSREYLAAIYRTYGALSSEEKIKAIKQTYAPDEINVYTTNGEVYSTTHLLRVYELNLLIDKGFVTPHYT
jgi:hypothetical protein